MDCRKPTGLRVARRGYAAEPLRVAGDLCAEAVRGALP